MRDLQITLVGVAPILSWRHFGPTGEVTANAASMHFGGWRHEIASLASAHGDVAAVTLASGIVSMSWTRRDGAGRIELVAARRALDGSWSTPAVVRTVEAGTTLLAPARRPTQPAG